MSALATFAAGMPRAAFTVSWLSWEDRDGYLDALEAYAAKRG